jgi:ankyrin repeat protein
LDEDLVVAARVGDVAAIRAAVAGGANVNAYEGTDDHTPLQWAALNGHTRAITALLSAGAHVDGRWSRGSAPLMFAASVGHADSINALLAGGADVSGVDGGGDSALHTACQFGRLHVIPTLLAAGARVDTRGADGALPIDQVRWVREGGGGGGGECAV